MCAYRSRCQSQGCHPEPLKGQSGACQACHARSRHFAQSGAGLRGHMEWEGAGVCEKAPTCLWE